MLNQLRLGNAVARMRAWWQGRVAPFGTRTYEDSREEMGDVPWKEVPKSTDAWYVIDEPNQAVLQPRPSRSRLLLVGGVGAAALAAITLGLIVHHRPPPPAPAAIAPPVAVAPVAPPAEVAPPAQPAAPPDAPPHRTAQHARLHHKKASATQKHAHR
jgi:hypothetical protein